MIPQNAGAGKRFLSKNEGYAEGAALGLLLGCKVHPRPRHRRMLRYLLTRQLPAVATRMQSTVSGQASFAGRAVRKAHSESQADRPENEYIYFPAGFLAFFCPETCPACFKLQAQFVCSSFPQTSPEWVQGAVSRRRLWRMQAGEGPMRHRAQAPALAPVPARQCRIVDQGRGGPDVPPLSIISGCHGTGYTSRY